ncbi:MAG: FG-GAP-like repeat-containing protein, partial [Acidobacteriota bacterium]
MGYSCVGAPCQHYCHWAAFAGRRIQAAMLCLVCALILAAGVEAAAVPFNAQQVISTDADFARSVHAGDVDGDGDLDLMSASSDDDTIAWYENDGGANPSFTRIVISTTADGARSVYAGDLDGDGDLDILSASADDDAIAWYENDGA